MRCGLCFSCALITQEAGRGREGARERADRLADTVAGLDCVTRTACERKMNSRFAQQTQNQKALGFDLQGITDVTPDGLPLTSFIQQHPLYQH